MQSNNPPWSRYRNDVKAALKVLTSIEALLVSAERWPPSHATPVLIKALDGPLGDGLAKLQEGGRDLVAAGFSIDGVFRSSVGLKPLILSWPDELEMVARAMDHLLETLSVGLGDGWQCYRLDQDERPGIVGTYVELYEDLVRIGEEHGLPFRQHFASKCEQRKRAQARKGGKEGKKSKRVLTAELVFTATFANLRSWQKAEYKRHGARDRRNYHWTFKPEAAKEG